VLQHRSIQDRSGYNSTMPVPSVPRRRRRAFFAPLWLGAILAMIAAFIAIVLIQAADTTTVIVVRHAEKQLGTIDDAPLSTEGELRAERLAQMLGQETDGEQITVVVASEARRSQQTAAPLARRLGLGVTTVPAGELAALMAVLNRQRDGTLSVVVAHSNTIPQIVAALAGKESRVTVNESDYGSMFVVTSSRYGPASVLRLRY